jgi:20S proteasome alpha/beta subunit
MTLGIVLTCPEGVVIGSDLKTVRNKGVDIQRPNSKITPFKLGDDVPLFCCHAGAKTVAERVLGQIDPEQHDDDKTENFTSYMSEVVEWIIPQFAQNHAEKHHEMPNMRIGMGTIQNGQPVAATVYPSGQFDYDEQYTAIGSGSLLAEHFLRDPFVNGCELEQARKVVGYIIQRVSEVDSNVEGIEVTSINTDGTVEQLSRSYITALQVADIFGREYRMEIESDIDEINKLAESFDDIRAGER